MPFLTLGGLRIHYQMAGSGHPLVFLHGHGLDSRMWAGQMDGLARLFTVVSYDLRGHGQSEAPPTGYSRADLAGDLFRLVEALDLSRPSIIGHSRGGTIGLEYVLAYPQRVSTLTMTGSGVEGYFSEEELAPTIARRKALLLREGVSARFIRASLRSPLYHALRGYPEKLALVRSMAAAWSGADWMDQGVYPRPNRLQIERLVEVSVPVLIAVGEKDLDVFHEVADVLAGGFRVARKATIPGAGHMAPLENPEDFNDILLDFIGGAAGKALL